MAPQRNLMNIIGKKMSKIKGLFFDLDGTLVNTIEANIKTYRKAIEESGRIVTDEQLREVFGLRYDTFLKMFYPEISTEDIERIKTLKAKYYPDFLHLIKPNEHLINFIKTLTPDHKLVLVTTAQKTNAMNVLKTIGIDRLFDHIICGNDVTNPKPNPEAYLKALEITKLVPAEVIVFEDSSSGIEAAEAAGLSYIRIEIN